MTRSAANSPGAAAWPPLLSQLPGLAWPALPGQQRLFLATLLAQLEQTQWLPAADMERVQVRQLRVLLEHAQRHSCFHAERLAGICPDQTQGLQECLSAIPLMRRADLQSRRAEIDCHVLRGKPEKLEHSLIFHPERGLWDCGLKCL